MVSGEGCGGGISLSGVKRCQVERGDVERKLVMPSGVVKWSQDMSSGVRRCQTESRDVKFSQDMSNGVRRCQGLSGHVR